jgi:hypothetical protein
MSPHLGILFSSGGRKMFMTSSIQGRLFGGVFGALAVIAVAACGTGPSAPTALPMGATAPTPVSFSGQSMADLAQCFGGSGDASCFNAGGSMRTASVNSGAVVGQPINLAASVSGQTVSLSWTAPATGDPVTGYVIEAGSAPGLSNLVNGAIPNTNALTVPGIPFGVYYVRVRATGAAGAGAASNEIQVTVGGCAGPPQGLVVSSQSAGTITLGWTPPASGAPTAYVIAAGSAPGLSDIVPAFTTPNANPSLVVPGVPAGSYYVRVHSRSSCGVSGASNEVLVFAVGSSGDVQVTVVWDAPSDVDLHVVEPSGEEIFYGHSGSATGGQLDVDSNAGCTIDGRQVENVRWPGRAPGGSYTVRVDYWDACDVAQTNYHVTVRNGTAITTFTGSFTGEGDHGGEGSGVTITTFVHAADTRTAADGPVFRAPALFTPSPIKLKRSNQR